MSSTPEVTAKVEKDKKTKKEKDLKDDKKDKDEKKEKKSKTEKTKLKDKESPSGSFIGKDFDKKDKTETVRERGLSKADRTKSPKPSRRHSVNKSTNGEDGEGKILKRTPSFGLLEKRKTCPELDRDDVNFEFSFFDSNDTIVLKDDEKNPFVHWENIVQMGGASRVLESFTKPSQSLNTLCRQYFRELGESKIELLKWIANNHLKGSKQAYLNYLCDHCCFQLKLVEKNAKTDALDITNATHAHLRKDSGGSGHRRSRSIGVSILSAVDDDDISRPLSRSEDTDISGSLGYSSGSHGSSSSRDGTEDDAENAANLSTSPTTYTMMQKRKTVVGSSAPFLTNPALAGQRKTKSVAVRSSSKVRPSIKNATFANNNSNRFATINDEDPNNNNSQKLSKSSGNLPTPTNTKPPILISPPSRTGSKRQIGNTTDPKKADLRAILEALIKQERIQEALECKKYVEILDKLQARQTQYESAKQEDRLHEAIAIRNEVNELIKQYDSLTSAQIAQWIQQDVEGHVTLQEMHELLIDKVGTKKALPFIEEFANANIQSFPPDELEKALEIQQKAKARLKEFQVSEVDEHEKERRRKEEEERWKKEAEERRAQKKKKTKELASIIKVNSNENLLDPPVKLFDQTDQS